MIAAQRLLLACALTLPALSAGGAFAQDYGRVRLDIETRAKKIPTDPRDLFAAPLPPGSAFRQLNGHGDSARAVNAYAPAQHVRLKQTIFTGAQ